MDIKLNPGGPWALDPALRRHPLYPSARVTLRHPTLETLLEMVAQIDCPNTYVCPDADAVLIPERESALIGQLQNRFDVIVTYGEAREYAFTTLASAAGLAPDLMELGHIVQDHCPLSVEDMLFLALADPERARAEWQLLWEIKFKA